MTDLFRKEYRELDTQAKNFIFLFKCLAENLLDELERASSMETTDKRCMALAKTKLEETVMWAVKAIT